MAALPEGFANLLRLCLDVPDRIVQQDEVLPVTGQSLFESVQLPRQGFQLRELLLKAPNVGVRTPELVAERLRLINQAGGEGGDRFLESIQILPELAPVRRIDRRWG